MNIGESVRTGFVEIYSHKMRSFLSFSAVMFGVAAILYTFANVNKMFEDRTKAFDIAGPGRLEIRAEENAENDKNKSLSKGLTSTDAEAIRRVLPWLNMVSPYLVVGGQEFRYGDFAERATVHGITTDWRKRDWVYTLRGRFFNEHDMTSAARVCILLEPGGWAGEKPFWAKWWKDTPMDSFVKRRDLIGRTVRVGSQSLTVVGQLKNPPKDKDPRWFRRGWGGSPIYVPLTTAQRYYSNTMRNDSPAPDAVDEIIVDTGKVETVPEARRRIESILLSRHRGVKDFKVEDFREMVQNMINRMKKHAIQVLSVGIVAILAGGVGIMNVTLATIFSRIREIGVRRAIGATKLDIMIQFVTEAMLLGILGGFAGIALGIIGLKYLMDDGQDIIQSLLWWHFVATLAISAFVGFIFSLYPAYQASKLDPVEALRYE